MAAESMSLRDMFFWFFLTLFGTGTYVIYGSQSAMGEVLGEAMIVVGLVGMLGCAWPHLRDPLTGKVQLTWGAVQRIVRDPLYRKATGRVIVTYIVIAAIGFSGLRVYRHYAQEQHIATGQPATPQPNNGTPQAPPIVPSQRDAVLDYGVIPPKECYMTVDTSKINTPPGWRMFVTCRATDATLDALEDHAIAKSNSFPIDGRVQHVVLELEQAELRQTLRSAEMEVYLSVVPATVEAHQINTLSDVRRLGGVVWVGGGIRGVRATTPKKKPPPLKQQPLVSPSVPPQTSTTINSAPNGIAISGGNVRNPTVNNYGPPPVEMRWSVRDVIPPMSDGSDTPTPSQFKFEQEVTVMVSARYTPVSIGVLCDSHLEDVNGFLRTTTVAFNKTDGIAADGKTAFTYFEGSPATPQQPLLIHIWANQQFKVLQVSQARH
jgi:hypothetical protein